LSEEEIAHAFEPFAQGSHAGDNGSPMYGGLGLGLAIVEELTAKHGGRVSVTSGGRGQGATFSFVLPLATQPPPGDARAETEVPKPAASPRRVLLVEDHAHTRTALQRMLQRRGHFVVPAGSRAEALAEAAQHRFDLLVSDIGLPDGDGYELLGELRKLQPHLQGIALSGFGMENDVRRSAAAGFSMHLVKPVSVSKLDAVIAQLPLG
jgi:CheY-like chemotaxis protein